MIYKNHIWWFKIVFLCISGIACATASDPEEPDFTRSLVNSYQESGTGLQDDSLNRALEMLNNEFQAYMTSGDTVRSGIVVNSIIKNLSGQKNDNLIFSDSYYYIGVYNLITGKNKEAAVWFSLSSSIRERLKCDDEIHAKCLFNLGVVYNNFGDFKRMEEYTLMSLEIDKKLHGESSPVLLKGLSNLITANFGLYEYTRAINFGNEALKLINGGNDNYSQDRATIYSNIGICYISLSDYSRAALYLEKAELIYEENSLPKDANYINLLNSLAATYFFLGLNDKADEYFKRGFEMTKLSNSILSFNFVNSFAVVLANAGRIDQGEELILNSLEKAKKSYGENSKDYFEVLKNYADYLRTFRKDIKKSLLFYEQCIGYLNDHKEDLSLRNQVILGYALTLNENGDSAKALRRIQELLFTSVPDNPGYTGVENPDIALIEPDRWSIDLLKAKYRILWDIFRKSDNYGYLIAASGTSEIIVALLEKVRINITEEESRLVLGDRYRDAYVEAIRDFDLCYRHTGREEYLGKAFEYAEKSKVAGLLASTRELKATQFHIPAEVAELERKLKTEISYYNAKISEENNKKSPDAQLIAEWKGNVFNAAQGRDSLVKLFEKQYPGYYLLKYNTEVVKPGDIPAVAGRNTNYLNYVVSDTVIYIFLANRKFTKLFTMPVDSGFFDNVREFRKLLSLPSPFMDAKSEFMKYQLYGGRIYRKILEPLRKYLISDKLLISPDNILSYIPFETIPYEEFKGDDILYRELPYMMNEFRISYAYSATVLAESVKKMTVSMSNSLIAFAPVYTRPINIDSVLQTRQVRLSGINDLPFARQEAEYVSELTEGTLCINDGATEMRFKAEAHNYDIIHLAMHTVLNDQFPMHSKMLFYQAADSVEDGNLNTYEVYNIPLKAKMVILSSCNTGSGKLNSGEGILSLARGFIYSGSQSVVMSMWEIEDRSGTEIVKDFYKYLKKGEIKSDALRKARQNFLKKADMLRSHPYFWSALVIYGNNESLYHSRKIYILAGAAAILLGFVLFLYYYKFR